MKVTGTFLDEITHDISSQNWSEEDWAKDFDAMKEDGIDTVILIRAGYRERATFDSKVLNRNFKMMPAYEDLVDLYLREAERTGMKFFFGTYDSGDLWNEGHYKEEVQVNKDFCSEVMEKYGDRRAFSGWYISHEINTFSDGMMGVYTDLSEHLKKLKSIPILISPYIKGVKQFPGEAISLEHHIEEWEQVFRRLEGLVDIVAFQDGHVPLEYLPDYLTANRELATKRGIESWSNVESFDRDVHIKFPPIDFRKLRYKIEQAEKANMSKLITFEYSHFMSPHADHPAARALNRKYRRWQRSLK
ncbi:MAG: DUF4434 domain-containing protein [Pseudomonadota bacterium]